MIPQIVYINCAFAASACAWLLLRGYRGNHSRLLLWSASAFGGLAIGNVLLFIDLVVVPQGPGLALIRAAVSFRSVLVLIVGLIWEGEA